MEANRILGGDDVSTVLQCDYRMYLLSSRKNAPKIVVMMANSRMVFRYCTIPLSQTSTAIKTHQNPNMTITPSFCMTGSCFHRPWYASRRGSLIGKSNQVRRFTNVRDNVFTLFVGHFSTHIISGEVINEHGCPTYSVRNLVNGITPMAHLRPPPIARDLLPLR